MNEWVNTRDMRLQQNAIQPWKGAQLSSVTQPCPTLSAPMDCNTPGIPCSSQSSLKLMSIESVMPFNHLILCRPLLLQPSNFLSIKLFTSESVLYIRWPKHWSFSFSISPTNEYSGLISFKIDWLDHLAVQESSLPGSSPGGSRVIRSGDGVSVLGINCLIKDMEGD